MVSYIHSSAMRGVPLDRTKHKQIQDESLAPVKANSLWFSTHFNNITTYTQTGPGQGMLGDTNICWAFQQVTA